jgi:hypothetical protein
VAPGSNPAPRGVDLIPSQAERIVRLSPTLTNEVQVPVTAKLSKHFYDVLGEDVANELVEWFNAVDLTYRADLRELNELNFARFDAKLEQRLTELRLDLLRWMFGFWATTMLTLAGLTIALLHR